MAAAAGRVQVATLCLASRADRWAAAKEALAGPCTHAGLTLQMVPALNAAELAAPLLPDVAAVERALSCACYRGWPICEVQDVRARFPELVEGLNDAEAWVAYERMYAVWPRDKARLWVDFYSRHLTMGDVGCSLSHLALWERHAQQPHDAVLLVLEDDARPQTDALAHLLEQAAAATAAGVHWELLYGHGTLYAHRQDSEERVPGTECVWAGHRKVTDCYLLTAAGARKLAGCGFRDCVLPVDDFLPAVHVASTHPRADVMALPCVRKLREGADGGLVALALAPGASRCGSACKTAGSASKHSPCLLGDMGAQVVDEDRGGVEDSTALSAPAARLQPSDNDAPREDEKGHEASRVASSRIAAVSYGDTVPSSAEELAEALARQVACRDGAWGVGPAPARLAAAAGAAEQAWWEFFAKRREEDKRRCVGTGGRGGPTQRLMLWGNGWTSQRCREQFHTVVGALDAQPMPSPEVAACTRELVRELKALACAALARLDPAAESARQKAEATHGDPSVFDAFYYFNCPISEQARNINMVDHVDPGLLTLKVAGGLAGLEMRSSGDGGWTAVEGAAMGLGTSGEDSCGRRHVLMFAAEQLEDTLVGESGGGVDGAVVRATRHRVARDPQGARLSLVFELRTHRADGS